MTRTNLENMMDAHAPASPPRRTRRLRVAVPLAALAMAAASCGGSDNGSSGPTSTPTSAPTSAANTGGGGYGTSSPSPSPSPSAPAGAGSTIATATVGNLGQVLVDAQGRTVYLFEKDTGGTSSCFGACAGVWPPVISSGKPQAGTGAKASMLGTTKRNDGTTQVTYGGHPLYNYAPDGNVKGSAKGQALNQFGAEWYVVSPAGKKVEKSGS
ncbi:COG4315 family predicted lipoprotein [Actinomadura roseirufa]|uniref:COG4315 family predicted lipoprotein n=1 Tax=Actinomadura roseirufa TaxID=2094049 RepID=UPI001F5FA8B0|nr:hypothetical protein [Actinomadura roseirufa]